jgi:hypothetical protein
VKKDQDDEAAWSALIYDYLSDQSRDTDERWGTALELLQLYEEPVGVIVMLAAGAAVPDWVRKELAAWCEGQRPPLPSCSDDDKKLLAAVEAYRTGRRKGEKKEQRIERIARECGVEKTALANFIDHEGGTYRRLVRDQRRWERIYLNPDRFK